jgi:hypothetical protein
VKDKAEEKIMEMNRTSPDQYITGNYGEKQFTKKANTASFAAGVRARRSNKPITSCRCRNPVNKREWRYGWCDEDMAIISGSQE